MYNIATDFLSSFHFSVNVDELKCDLGIFTYRVDDFFNLFVPTVSWCAFNAIIHGSAPDFRNLVTH